MLKSAEQSKHAQLAETLQAGEFCGNTISIGTGAYSATQSVCAVVAHCSKQTAVLSARLARETLH